MTGDMLKGVPVPVPVGELLAILSVDSWSMFIRQFRKSSCGRDTSS